MMKFIPDDTNIDFMGARKKAFVLSGVAVLGSLLIVATMGLNKGIDFKGGSSVIVEFKKDSITESLSLETSVADLIDRELGEEATQVSVQTFDSGIQSQTEAGVPIDRFIIYTEATSLISADRKANIAKALEETFKDDGKDARAKYPAEGSDVYYLTLPEKKKVKEVEAKIRSLLVRDCAKEGGQSGLCFKNFRVMSDYERQINVGNIKDLNLVKSESTADENAKEELRELERRQKETKDKRLANAEDKRFTITIEELKSKLEAHLKKDFGETFVQVASSTSVSPSVGEALLNDGLLAILYAIIGILLYITMRFDFRFAPGAVVALVHDVIITIGIFSIFQVKFSLPIIAALLTIVGYSLNDTIVVLDRVRETFTDFRGADLKDLLNRAINNTLSRTVLTSVTTLIVVICILVLGGGLIRDFAWALFIGIIVGTYSSIFIACPLVYYMDIYLQRREDAQRKMGGGAHAKPA